MERSEPKNNATSPKNHISSKNLMEIPIHNDVRILTVKIMNLILKISKTYNNPIDNLFLNYKGYQDRKHNAPLEY